jgi:uncharacterized protein YbjT (DUF2867 family)
MRICVLGATGTVGRALVPVLAARGHEVVAASRHPPDRLPAGARGVAADVLGGSGLEEALAGADVAVYLVHSLGAGDFEARDRQAAAKAAAAARAAGVRRIVYLGGIYPVGALSPHLASRRETGEVLAGEGVPVTTLGAAAVIGTGSASFEIVRALVDRLPVMLCPRWVSTKTQPIALRDVVEYLAELCEREEASGRAFEAGGPEAMTYREMIERVAAIRGKRRLLVDVPVLTPWLSALWLRLVTPAGAGVAMPLVEGLRNETIARDGELRSLAPIELTPFDEAVREALRHGETAAAGP